MRRPPGGGPAGLVLLALIAGFVAVLLLGPNVRPPWRRPEEDVACQSVIHHFERAAWFAMNTAAAAGPDPALGPEFERLAAWHYRRAREFQRMTPEEVAWELERAAEHERDEGRVMTRALSLKMGATSRGRDRSGGGWAPRTGRAGLQPDR